MPTRVDEHRACSRSGTVPNVPLHRPQLRATAALAAASFGALVLAGCTSTPQTVAPPPAALKCRKQWTQLVGSLAQQGKQSNPSDLASRWTTIAATAQYYETSASAADCGSTLSDTKQTIQQTQAFIIKIRSYDMVYRTASVAPQATDYLTNKLPKAKKIKGKRVVPPTKAAVRKALSTLKSQARASATNMQDGWGEADQVDLTNAKAVAKTLSDLKFLAGDSSAYQACAGALKVLERAAAFES